MRPPDIPPVVMAGSAAAGLLETTFTQDAGQPEGPPGNQRIGLVRDLARDIKAQLEALAHSAPSKPSPDLMAEAALRCADLANLAACNLDALPAGEVHRAAAGVHLAAGTIKALRLLAQDSDEISESNKATLRDLRGAGWRGDLAVRQVGALLESSGGS